jgi:chromosome segregation ATPase
MSDTTTTPAQPPARTGPTTMDLLEARTERNEAIKRAEAAEAELVRQQALWAEVEIERDTLRGRAELAEHLVTVLQGRLDEGPIHEGGVSQEMREMTKTLEQTAVAVQAAALRTLQVERDELRARIEDMSQRAESLQSRCDELESQILALCGRWDAAESLLKEADARAEAAEAERDALRAAVAQLEAAAQTPTSPEGGR